MTGDGLRVTRELEANTLERVELPGVERKLCDELSKGMLQKVQFVTAVVHQPDLLILDDITAALARVGLPWVLATILLSTAARSVPLVPLSPPILSAKHR